MSHIAMILIGAFFAAVLLLALALCKAARLGDEAQRQWDEEMERRERLNAASDDDTTRTWTSGDEGRA